MANRKTLKRSINLICSDLFAECMAVSLYDAKVPDENINALFRSIIRLESDFVSRISHVEPGMPAKTYFKDLREQFTAQASDIIDQLYNLH